MLEARALYIILIDFVIFFLGYILGRHLWLYNARDVGIQPNHELLSVYLIANYYQANRDAT